MIEQARKIKKALAAPFPGKRVGGGINSRVVNLAADLQDEVARLRAENADLEREAISFKRDWEYQTAKCEQVESDLLRLKEAVREIESWAEKQDDLFRSIPNSQHTNDIISYHQATQKVRVMARDALDSIEGEQ